ncbi:hypothetical protein ACFS5M_12355 [Lacinutrix iliipiscaria]|uniref:Uncharacterized protein n=1 Tax=Lacinutrix iliipiscaria TaxID=1230532 RepID=A0ABW5WR75_9FLAO
MKIPELITKPKNNIIGILIAMIISWIIGMSADLSASSGHGGFIPLVYPPMAAIFFIILYYISRLLTKKYNWIITLFAIIHLLYFAIDFYITENI